MRVKYREHKSKYSALVRQNNEIMVQSECNPCGDPFVVDISEKIIASNIFPELEEKVDNLVIESISHIQESSKIALDTKLPIHYDDNANLNYVYLSKIPMGEIISFVVTTLKPNNKFESIVIDGNFNIVGRKLEFLTEGVNQYGSYAEVKYLVR